MRLLAALLASALVVAGERVAGAAETAFPLVVDYRLLESALEHEFPREADGRVLLWGGGGGCRFLTLQDVRLSPAGDRIRVTARGAARIGFELFGFCIGPVSWEGYVETLATPDVTPAWKLRFRDLDSRVYDSEWRRNRQQQHRCPYHKICLHHFSPFS